MTRRARFVAAILTGTVAAVYSAALRLQHPDVPSDLLHVLCFRPDPPVLSMGWCVDCHREQNASRGLQAPLDCVACHH